MKTWNLEQKIAATLFLILLGLGTLAGAINVALEVGVAPTDIEKRYSAPSPSEQSDPMALLEEPPVTLEKLMHVVHAHLIPYALIFGVVSFFILQLSFVKKIKIGIIVLFAFSIVGDFTSMLATRFVASGFYMGIAISGFLFMSIVAGTILVSLYELWFTKKDFA